MRHELTENEKNRIRNLHESYSNHNGSLILNEEEAINKQIDALGATEGVKYCRADKGTKFAAISNLISKLKKSNPKVMKGVKSFMESMKGKSVKQLFAALKDLRKARKALKKQGKQEVNEQMTPLVIAGVSIAPGILIAAGALIVIIIIVMILKNGKGGSCNPGWWDNL
tara:strand:+ start:304 stop:810 length:507 start_codon:yes stop_codon:yes gene_type:complete